MERVVALALVLVLVLSAACGEDDRVKYEQLVLGAVMDQSGVEAEPSWLRAMELALQHMNAALRFEKYKNLGFRLIATDSEGAPDRAVQRATALVKDEGAKALVIDTGPVAEALNALPYDGDEANDLDVPYQCGSCTSGSLLSAAATDSDPLVQAARRNTEGWLSRTIMAAGAQAGVLAQIIASQGTSDGDQNGDGILKVSAYGGSDSYGLGTTTATINHLKVRFASREAAGTLATERILHLDAEPSEIAWASDIELLTNDRNDTTPASSVADATPDFIAVASAPRHHLAFTQAYGAAGKDVPVLHYQGMRSQVSLRALGAAAEGLSGVSHALIDGAAGTEFAAAFAVQYDERPAYRDAVYYDNAATLMLAILLAQRELAEPAVELTGAMVRDARPCTSATTPACLRGGTATLIEPSVEGFRRAIAAIVEGRPIDYVGASGPVDYDASGNVRGKLAHYRVEGGEFVDVGVYDCVSSDACSAQ